MANIAQIAAQYQSNFVSAYDVHKPDVLSKMFNRYGDQGSSWFLTLEKLGFVKPVAATQYSHYENELKNPTFKSRASASIVGSGATATILITLAVADVDTNNNFYPRLNDIVFFKTGQLGIITSINVSTPSAPVLTINALNANALPASVAAGEEMSLVSNAFAEGSDQPKGIVPGATKRTNYTQIMKETLAVTGTELTNQTWFDGWVEVPGSVNGSEQIASGNSWYNLNWMDMEWRIGKQVSGALLFGEASVGNGVVDPTTGLPVNTTNGLIPTIKTQGNTETYVPGSFSVTDFDAYGRILDREYAGDYVLGLTSKSFSDEIENTMVAYLANTNIIYEIEQQLGSRFGVDGKSISVDFNYLKKSQRTFMFKRMMEFSNRQTFGIANSVTDGYGVFLPMNKVKDAKSGKMLDNIGARYKNLNGYSRKMEVWSVNGAGPGMKVSSVDVNKSFIRTDMGAHIMGANQMILVKTV
jgi:hypothetical protein